jgi:hypothetical protein
MSPANARFQTESGLPCTHCSGPSANVVYGTLSVRKQRCIMPFALRGCPNFTAAVNISTCGEHGQILGLIVTGILAQLGVPSKRLASKTTMYN